MSLRDEILSAIAEKPRSPLELAALLDVPVNRVAVCLAALDRDNRVTLTTRGWARCRLNGRKERHYREYEFVTPHLRVAVDNGCIFLRGSDGEKERSIAMSPVDARAFWEHLNAVGVA